MMVYLARDIPLFVLYCVSGECLIPTYRARFSIDSMIVQVLCVAVGLYGCEGVDVD